MLGGRLEILAYSQQVAIDLSELLHRPQQLLGGLTESDHETGLRDQAGIQFFGLAQKPQRAQEVCLGPHLRVKARNGLYVVIDDVGVGVPCPAPSAE
jgi:hypothetical protein